MYSYWEYVSHQLENTYFLQLFWYLSSAFAVFIGIRNYKREKIFIFFIAYLIAQILISAGTLLLDYYIIRKDIFYTKYQEIKNTIFEVIEISVFSYFFAVLFNSKIIKTIIKFFVGGFVCASIIFFITIVNKNVTKTEVTNWSFLINVFEFILLLPLTFYYFYHLLSQEISKTISLISYASFWITIGLFFYVIVSLPLLLAGGTLYAKDKWLYHLMYSFHYFAIGILSLCIAKAFSCKTTLTT